MASVVVYIKKDYLDKNGESSVIMQYDHLYKRWMFNTGLKANPKKIDCAYDEDTELWKLASISTLKPSERKKLAEANEALRDIALPRPLR